MGFRFRQSVKILPGVRLNIGKRGMSVSVGGKGATTNISRRGVRTTLGIPGTGLSYSSYAPFRSKPKGTRPARPIPSSPQVSPYGRVWVVVGILGVLGLILMSAGALGAASLFVVCALCVVVFAAWIGAAIRHGRAQTPQPLPPPDKNDPHYYRIPGPFDDYVGKPKETPHGTQENTTQPLPPVDRTSPDYYWSPGLLDNYRDKSHD